MFGLAQPHFRVLVQRVDCVGCHCVGCGVGCDGMCGMWGGGVMGCGVGCVGCGMGGGGMCGMWDVGWDVWDVGWDVWDVGCGVGCDGMCGMWGGVGCGCDRVMWTVHKTPPLL